MANKKWNKIPLKKLCSRIGDGLHGTPEYVFDSEIYFINGNNLKNGRIEITSDTKRVTASELSKNFIPLNENSLLLSINGTLGSMAFYNGENVMLGKSAAYLNFNSNINQFYYYYFQLKGVQEYFYNVATGSTIKNLSLKSIQDFEVPVPEESDRNGIVRILKSLDAKIELNNKINRELEAMAKTLYDYWFVQFDFPNEQGKPYKSSGGKMVYNKELKREIPEGWEVEQINSKVTIGSGFPFNSDDYSLDGMYKIITIKNVQDGFLDTSTVDYISFLPKNISNFCILNEGDILMSLTGNVGRMCIVDEPNLLLNQRVGKLIGDIDFVNYTYFFFKRPENQKRLEKIAGGSSQANLSPIEAVKDKFPIPAQFVLNKFSEKIKPLKNQILNKNRENQELSSLRDWLLPMLMNGQVTVQEAEERLSMAAEPSVEYKKDDFFHSNL